MIPFALFAPNFPVVGLTQDLIIRKSPAFFFPDARRWQLLPPFAPPLLGGTVATTLVAVGSVLLFSVSLFDLVALCPPR